MRKQITRLGFVLCLVLLWSSPILALDSPALNSQDTNTAIRTPLTHGFWFPKLIAIGEEWYRGRLVQSHANVTETDDLPDLSDPTGHNGFTAINSTKWNITHHWFGGDSATAETVFYSQNMDWFFDAAAPQNSVMGVFALFRWGFLNEIDARLAIHDMITVYTTREYRVTT